MDWYYKEIMDWYYKEMRKKHGDEYTILEDRRILKKALEKASWTPDYSLKRAMKNAKKATSLKGKIEGK